MQKLGNSCLAGALPGALGLGVKWLGFDSVLCKDHSFFESLVSPGCRAAANWVLEFHELPKQKFGIEFPVQPSRIKF